jgi:hypothetical protein
MKVEADVEARGLEENEGGCRVCAGSEKCLNVTVEGFVGDVPLDS